jgi:hypothetical protein
MSFELRFFLVLVSMTLVDICYTMYIIQVEKRKAISAGVWAAAILCFSGFVTINYVDNFKLLIAAIIGSFIGTAGTIWFKRKKN